MDSRLIAYSNMVTVGIRKNYQNKNCIAIKTLSNKIRIQANEVIV